jgi:hypothetical protein
MDAEKILVQLGNLLDQIEKANGDIIKDYEKFEVALTGVLRLLSGEGTSITSIKGSPDDLIRYLIRQLTKLQKETLVQLEAIREELLSVRKSVQNS